MKSNVRRKFSSEFKTKVCLEAIKENEIKISIDGC
jgi:hypothetical protein